VRPALPLLSCGLVQVAIDLAPSIQRGGNSLALHPQPLDKIAKLLQAQVSIGTLRCIEPLREIGEAVSLGLLDDGIEFLGQSLGRLHSGGVAPDSVEIGQLLSQDRGWLDDGAGLDLCE
jgi:hypothetical protein